VLGGFTVGDGAKIGSNAVVIKPVPPGATAVGIPARIIASKEGESADVTTSGEAAVKDKFSAYGITHDDDPLSLAMRALIDHAAHQEDQIALLWQRLEKLSGSDQAVKPDASDKLDTRRVNELIGK
jgi:serine O-acetyltransferase